MGRTRYKIYELTHPHFVTCTVLHWLPIFTRKESVQIIVDCIKFLQEKDNLKVYKETGDWEKTIRGWTGYENLNKI